MTVYRYQVWCRHKPDFRFPGKWKELGEPQLTKAKAAAFIADQQELDARPPVAFYEYRIETIRREEEND